METKAHKKRAVKAEKIAAAKQKAANAHTHEHEHEHEHEHTHDDNCTHSNDDAVENKDADGMKVETEPKKKFEGTCLDVYACREEEKERMDGWMGMIKW